MRNLNMAVFAGRVGREPEIRYTQNGSAVTNFSVAVTGYSKDRDNEPTHWLDCQAWGKLAELIHSRVPKGGRVVVHAEMRQEKWKAQDGSNRQTIRFNVQDIEIFDWNDANGPATQLEAQVESLEVADTVATARVELRNWTGHRFTDLFTLLKVDDEWKIMNKVFHLHA